MIQYIYVSSSVKPFSNEELLELLGKSRENNERLGITGMLVYKGGVFIWTRRSPRRISPRPRRWRTLFCSCSNPSRRRF
jgi:hypothetical protein